MSTLRKLAMVLLSGGVLTVTMLSPTLADSASDHAWARAEAEKHERQRQLFLQHERDVQARLDQRRKEDAARAAADAARKAADLKTAEQLADQQRLERIKTSQKR